MKEIKDFIEKAEKFLTTAEHALDIGDYDSCVSRSYYAMFFMAEAGFGTLALGQQDLSFGLDVMWWVLGGDSREPLDTIVNLSPVVLSRLFAVGLSVSLFLR